MYNRTIYRAGDTIEVMNYYGRGRHPEGMKRQSTSKTPEQIARANRNQQIKKLNRIINANFKKGDMYYTLTYKREWEKPATEEELLKDITNHLRRMSERMKRRGLVLVYVYTYSMGKSGNNPHAHIITNIPMGYEEHEEMIKQLWIKLDATIVQKASLKDVEAGLQVWDAKGRLAVLKGFIHFARMWEGGQYMALAVYLVDHSYTGEVPQDRETRDTLKDFIAEAEKDMEAKEEGVAKEQEAGSMDQEKAPGKRTRRKHKKAFEHSRSCTVPQPERTVVKAGKFHMKPRPIKGYYIQPGSVKSGIDLAGWPYLSYTLVRIPNRAGRNAAGARKERAG